MTDATTLAREFDALEPTDLPPSVDYATVERMRTVARLLDRVVEVPGTNIGIGLDPVLGALPVAGDAIAAGVSLYVVLEAARLGVSYGTLLRMLANVAIDFVGGSVPVFGVVFDALWEANVRNLGLVIEELTEGKEP